MSSSDNKEYSVCWKNHMGHVRKAFDQLLNDDELTDVTLCCDNRQIKAHKVLLSACSSYFRDTFKEVPCKHPVIVLIGVEYELLMDILKFIYAGEVSVDNSRLDSFFKLAQVLKISGLTEGANEGVLPQPVENIKQTASIQNDSKKQAETRKVVKRSKPPEPERSSEINKISKQEDNTVFVSDIKAEPAEVYGLGAEDPLLESEDQTDFTNYDYNAMGQGSEEITEFKKKKTFWPTSSITCNICDKVFSHPFSLQQHKPVHEGGTRCTICSAVLSRKYHLKLHMKSRHNIY